VTAAFFSASLGAAATGFIAAAGVLPFGYSFVGATT
jgi:hypothetical protein